MGDASNQSGPPPSDHEVHASAHPGAASPAYADPRPPVSAASFQSQYPHHSLEVHRSPQQQQQHPVFAYNMPAGQGAAFNMGTMNAALPDYTSTTAMQSPHQPQRGISGASTSAVVYQLQQISQYPQAAMGFASQPNYGAGYPTSQFSPPYPTFASGQPRTMAPAQMHHSFMQYPQAQPYMYYPGPYAAQHPMNQPPVAYGAGADARRASLPTAQMPAGAGMGSTIPAAGFVSVLSEVVPKAPSGDLVSDPVLDRSKAQLDSGHTSLPRGPPRKPRQSGHALWVGNLPPGTTVVDLKDHFSREATKDIESLFLISKSNCAFVNYKTEASCTAAMHRFHDSRFHGVRLVCRLRRSAAPASGVPTGPSAMSIPRQPNILPEQSVSPQTPTAAVSEEDNTPETEENVLTDGVDAPGDGVSKVPEKFFIVKSLTLQDLELSVRNGIWATQSHNEDVLNRAYEAAENVYLIFSANKSGEYFGYARMASAINDNGIDLVHSVPETQASEATDTPKSIPTPATEWAPKGRIIDDSARGTIFWEAEVSEEEDEDETPDGTVHPAESDGPDSPQTWGKPFRIEWISTNRLPFYRTRGLRNPWNANREVKIARDGTELEPGVGKRLIQMFHRLGPPNTGPVAMPLMPMPNQVVGPQIRPF
ncbi:hypothetical protein MPH_08186 [Macrophomina phaseolina MS6]|uniref:YTH domain-containing protein n=1 Tax=Macrophomina phaseolina (strain MS6) TaxID=1126212 RepID=K2RJ90_MACPH|nr:hypothetical protein MPH_08186 [Macrophomina phaseolina MS6]